MNKGVYPMKRTLTALLCLFLLVSANLNNFGSLCRRILFFFCIGYFFLRTRIFICTGFFYTFFGFRTFIRLCALICFCILVCCRGNFRFWTFLCGILF